MALNNNYLLIPDQRGFTLIELFVSLAIIATLSALAITSYSILKENAYNAEQKQLYVNARSSLEGRNDKINQIGGQFRRIWQHYNSNVWELRDVTNIKDLAPGIPRIIPDHIEMYVREDKCGTTTGDPWCFKQWVESWNCKTGNHIRFYEYNNGVISYTEWYDAGEDNLC